MHTGSHTHTDTHTKDIKAQGIANVEDALKHDLSKHINDPFHPCILFPLLTVKTPSRKKKKIRYFLCLINMQKKHKHPHAPTHIDSKQNLQIYSTSNGTPFGILAQTDTLGSATVKTESLSLCRNLRKSRERELYKKEWKKRRG